jgi:hypothetical protein
MSPKHVVIKKLYKYLQPEHARGLLERGTVRIGTLYDYRRNELGAAIGDENEGQSRTEHGVDFAVDMSRPENQSWVSRSLLRTHPMQTGIMVRDSTFYIEDEDPDCFLYCMSHRFSGRAMRAFKADACVEILQPGRFIETMVTALRTRGYVLRATLSPCDYSGRVRDENAERLPPVLIKDPHYSYQSEIRLIMEPASPAKLEPFIESIPELTAFCRIRPT